MREVFITLDGVLVFQGEVTRAPGNAAEAPACAETILFTTEEPALAAIELHDGERYGSGRDEECQGGRMQGAEEALEGNTRGLELVADNLVDPLDYHLVGRGKPVSAAPAGERPLTTA